MNDHITAFIRSFVLEQEVDVYQNGECVKTVKCTLDNIEKVINNLIKEYNISQIDIAGSKEYAFKIKEHLQTKYSKFKDNLKINIY